MSDNISSLPYWNCNLVKQISCTPPPPSPRPLFSWIRLWELRQWNKKPNSFCYRTVFQLTRSRMVSFYIVMPRDWLKHSAPFSQPISNNNCQQQFSSRTISSRCFSCLAPIAWIGFQIGVGVNRLTNDITAEKGGWKKCSYLVNFNFTGKRRRAPVILIYSITRYT